MREEQGNSKDSIPLLYFLGAIVIRDYSFIQSLAPRLKISIDATDKEWSEFLIQLESYLLDPINEAISKYWDSSEERSDE